MDASFFRGMAVGFALAAPVGPVGLLVIRLALTQGRAAAVMAGLGAAIGDTIFGAVAGLGIAAVRSFINTYQIVLGLTGIVIVVVLGIATLRKPIELDLTQPTVDGLVRDFMATFAMTITNPATMVAALGVFAAMGSIDATLHPFRAAGLIIGIFAGSGLWWLMLASLAGAARRRMADGTLQWVNRLSGGLLIAFGIGLAVALAMNGGADVAPPPQ